MLMPVPQNGKCCPDGHMGYITVFTGYSSVNRYFDQVMFPPENV